MVLLEANDGASCWMCPTWVSSFIANKILTIKTSFTANEAGLSSLLAFYVS